VSLSQTRQREKMEIKRK